jgi:hypothetical protein
VTVEPDDAAANSQCDGKRADVEPTCLMTQLGMDDEHLEDSGISEVGGVIREMKNFRSGVPAGGRDPYSNTCLPLNGHVNWNRGACSMQSYSGKINHTEKKRIERGGEKTIDKNGKKKGDFGFCRQSTGLGHVTVVVCLAYWNGSRPTKRKSQKKRISLRHLCDSNTRSRRKCLNSLVYTIAGHRVNHSANWMAVSCV